jgi:hypothetical protein
MVTTPPAIELAAVAFLTLRLVFLVGWWLIELTAPELPIRW